MAQRFRIGRVFLMGDAAHIHSPAGGQGMNTGIGDAFNLAWKLVLVVKGQAHEMLLDSYEAERLPFARAILRNSDQMFQPMATAHPVLQRLKMYVTPLLFRLLLALPFLQRRYFWLLSQLGTNYRNSPVVAESDAGKKELRAGDRAPYGFFEDGPACSFKMLVSKNDRSLNSSVAISATVSSTLTTFLFLVLLLLSELRGNTF